MEFILENKMLIVGETIIGTDSENKSDEVVIHIKNKELLDKMAFIEFETSNGHTYTTPQLEVIDEKINYTLPNSLMVKGYLNMQIVFRELPDFIWKSYVIKLVVKESINASGDFPRENPEFVITVLEQLSILNEKAEDVEQRLSILEHNTAPARLNVLPTAQGRVTALLYVDDNGIESKISIDELGKRIIETTDNNTYDVGKYIFNEIRG